MEKEKHRGQQWEHSSTSLKVSHKPLCWGPSRGIGPSVSNSDSWFCKICLVPPWDLSPFCNNIYCLLSWANQQVLFACIQKNLTKNYLQIDNNSNFECSANFPYHTRHLLALLWKFICRSYSLLQINKFWSQTFTVFSDRVGEIVPLTH